MMWRYHACRFEFQGDPDLVAWDCNCSLCASALPALHLCPEMCMPHSDVPAAKVNELSCSAVKRNTHVIVPSAQFTILQGGASSLTEYQVSLQYTKVKLHARWPLTLEP